MSFVRTEVVTFTDSGTFETPAGKKVLEIIFCNAGSKLCAIMPGSATVGSVQKLGIPLSTREQLRLFCDRPRQERFTIAFPSGAGTQILNVLISCEYE